MARERPLAADSATAVALRAGTAGPAVETPIVPGLRLALLVLVLVLPWLTLTRRVLLRRRHGRGHSQRPLRIETFQRQRLDVGLDDPGVDADLALHPSGRLDLVGLHERDDHSAGTGTRCAAGTVDVRLVVLGRV